MNYKKFGLVSLIISAVIAISCFCLCFIYTGTALNVKDAEAFYIYNKSEVSTEVTATSNATLYNSLNESLKNLTNISIFSRFAQGGKLDELPSQDIDAEIGYYSSTLKNENVCLEITFETKQQQLLKINGNNKMVEYYGMLFVLNNDGPTSIAIYLSTSAGTRRYTGLPLLVRGDTSTLYSLCKDIKKD